MSAMVVLAAIVILALILVPSLGERIDTQLSARARSDCISIGAAILRFRTDTGIIPKWHAGADAQTPGAVGATVLAGPGRLPREGATGGWTQVPSAELSSQLAFNNPNYAPMPPGGPLGWNGPYLSPGDIGPDPWNHCYLANIGLLELPLPGGRRPGLKAVWVLSAGPNGLIETPLIQDADRARPGGDDIIYRLQ